MFTEKKVLIDSVLNECSFRNISRRLMYVSYGTMVAVVKQHSARISLTEQVPRGRNSSVGSVLGSLSCLMQRRGFDLPLRRIVLVEGIFLLELTRVLTPFPTGSIG